MAFDNHYQQIEPLLVTWPSDGCRDIGLIRGVILPTWDANTISGSDKWILQLICWIKIHMYHESFIFLNMPKYRQNEIKAAPLVLTMGNDLIAVNIVNHFEAVQCSAVWADTCIILLLHVSHHSSVLLFWRCPHGQSLSWVRLRWLSMSSARLIEPPLTGVWQLLTTIFFQIIFMQASVFQGLKRHQQHWSLKRMYIALGYKKRHLKKIWNHNLLLKTPLR